MYLQEKALHSDDYGKDLAGVEALQRKHKELEHDLTALEKKLEVKFKNPFTAESFTEYSMYQEI